VTAGALATTLGAPAGAAVRTLSFSKVQAIASPRGATMTFRATLSAAAGPAVSVHFATPDGTAVAGTDYVATSGTLKIPHGSTSGSVKVTLLPVALGAGGSDKSFSLTLSNARGASLSTPSVTGTIHPDVFVKGSRDAFADVVIDPASTTAYLTVPAKNEVAVLHLRTGTYSKPIPVGSDPQGIDITPDGTTLYVCDFGGQTISKVVIATREVTTITTPPGLLNETPFSIAIMNNGHALYSTTFVGSGFSPIYDLNLSTHISTVAKKMGVGGDGTEFTPLSRSADYSTAGAVLGDLSSGEFDIYTAATGKVVRGSLNAFISSSSLDGDGSTMLIHGRYVIDAASGTLLGTISGTSGSSVLTRTGATGYCLESQAIVRLNIGKFRVTKTITLPQPAAAGAQLALSHNGHVLVAETQGGATIVEL
jgi:DNA-binding beta-propeller fold protein YncE